MISYSNCNQANTIFEKIATNSLVIMSWFGFGGSKDSDKGSKPVSSYSSEYDDDSSDFSAPSSYSLPSAPMQGSGSLESELMMEQQKALVQAIMFKLTETAFERCVTKPSSSLSSSETSCISAVVTKYLDASEFVVKELSK